MNNEWCKAVKIAVVGACLTLVPAVWAQKAADDGPADSKPAAEAPKPASAVPAPANPAPMPAKYVVDPHIVPGSDYPHWEWFLGYSYLNGRVGSDIKSYNGNGGSSNIEYNFNRWFGLVADLGFYHAGTVDHVSMNANQGTYLFGPRLNYRFGEGRRHNLFGQVLLGGAHTNSRIPTLLTFPTLSDSKDGFGMVVGGGLDVGVAKHVAIRLIQAEYLLTDYSLANGYKPQNDFRYSAGVVLRWGAKPEFRNTPPTATCSTDVPSVVEGSGTSVPVRANASDADGDTLTYAWSANGGSVDGNGPVARWNSTNAAPGSYAITANVSDGHGGSTSCSANVRVEPRPLRAPSVSCSVDRSTVQPGERVTARANAVSNENLPLDYAWRSNGGTVSGSGPTVSVDTTGLTPGSYAVSARVSDKGGAADCSAPFNVAAPPEKPSAVRLGECIFKKMGSTRVDNVCSRLLDDAVLRMQNDPGSSLVLIGYEDPDKETKGKVADTRSGNAKKYVTGKKGGIDPSRASTRKGAGTSGADTANRRVEIYFVPSGATF